MNSVAILQALWRVEQAFDELYLPLRGRLPRYNLVEETSVMTAC